MVWEGLGNLSFWEELEFLLNWNWVLTTTFIQERRLLPLELFRIGGFGSRFPIPRNLNKLPSFNLFKILANLERLGCGLLYYVTIKSLGSRKLNRKAIGLNTWSFTIYNNFEIHWVPPIPFLGTKNFFRATS